MHEHKQAWPYDIGLSFTKTIFWNVIDHCKEMNGVSRVKSMNFRRAEIRDFLAIAALDRQAWGKNRYSTYIPDGEHAWRLWVEHAHVFCAQNDQGEIMGAILAFPCVQAMSCVHKVFVDGRVRRQGIGSALFEMLLKELDRETASSFLTVAPENSAAIKLYEKWGFRDKELVRGYYRSNEDRYVMTRSPQ